MNSLFRKVASPLMSSIFRKGFGGLSSLFKKAPTLTQTTAGIRRASNIANKLANNPVLEGLAQRQGYGGAFNLAKQGAGRLNQVADLGDKVKERRQEGMNILEKVKPFIPTGKPFDDIRNFA